MEFSGFAKFITALPVFPEDIDVVSVQSEFDPGVSLIKLSAFVIMQILYECETLSVFFTVTVAEVIVLEDSVSEIFVISTSGAGTETLSSPPILFIDTELFKFAPKLIVDTAITKMPISK